MITPHYVVKMAEYNAWMNGSLYAASLPLSDARRKADCGAFFCSIHKTLNHILWGDQIWTHRLADWPMPASSGIDGSTTMYDHFEDLHRERNLFDRALLDWSGTIKPADLDGDLTWFSAAAEREFTSPRWQLFVHMFNHQTHHRGQVHAMLSQLGAKPPVTDLPFMT